MTDHEYKVGDLVKINERGGSVNGGIWLEGTAAKIIRLPQSANDWYMLERDDDGDENLYSPSEFDLVAYQVSPNTTMIVGELTEPVVLNDSDPFEAVLVDIVRTNRAKRKDYAIDGSPFSNFDDTSDGMGVEGFGAVESAEFNIRQKLARLRSLRQNGRLNDPANESVNDTYLDLAVYGVIALAIRRYPDGKVV